MAQWVFPEGMLGSVFDVVVGVRDLIEGVRLEHRRHPLVARVHADDRRLWPLLFRLEHVNRWWQRRVRRRPYEFLGPERTTYQEHATT